MTDDSNPRTERNHDFHCLQRVEIEFRASGRVRGWTREEEPRLVIEMDDGRFAEFPAEYVTPEPTEADNVVPLVWPRRGDERPMPAYIPPPCDTEPGDAA